MCVVIESGGEDERRVQIACAKYRLVGEWFQHTREARDAIIAAIGKHIRFPIPLYQPMTDKSKECSEAFQRLVTTIRSHVVHTGLG